MEKKTGTKATPNISIRALRKKLGLTQTQFAERLGVNFVTVSRWENGIMMPSRLALNALSLLSEVVTPEQALTAVNTQASTVTLPRTYTKGKAGKSGDHIESDTFATRTAEGANDILKMFMVFSDLGHRERDELLHIATELRLRPGQFVYHEGDSSPRFYLVAQGRVKILKHSPQGKEFLVAFRSRGDMFGSLTLSTNLRRALSAKAATEVKLLALTVDDFLSFLSRHPELGIKVLRKMLALVGTLRANAVRSLTALAGGRVDHRLAFVLFDLSSEFGSTLDISREELAQMVGTTPETASRITNRLKKAGIVVPSRGKIVISDKSKLAEFV